MPADQGSDQLFRIALEAAPTGMLLVDHDGKIVLVNVEFERLFGYDRKELIGQPIEMLLPERFRAHHGGLRGGFFEKPSTRPMGQGRELFGLRKDGSEVPIEIGLNPLQTAEGNFVLSSVSDITARKAAERERHAAAARLAQVEATETFRTVFDQSPIAMAILNQDVQFVRVNAAWTRLLGYAANELVGKSPADLTHPDDRAEDAPFLSALVQGEIRSYSREKRYVKRDGSVVHVLLHAASVSDSTGRYYVGQLQDISERVRAEQAVQRLQTELARQVEIRATMLDNLPSGAVFLVDRELRYLSASGPGVVELLGVPPEELTGKNARELIPARYQEEVLARLDETLRGKKVAFEAVRGDRVFEARMAPIYSGAPLPVAALVHLYDITERKQQALALEAERTRYRALVDHAPVGVFEMDAAGNALYVNDKWLALTGLTAEQARSPAMRRAGVHPDDRVRLLEEWGQAKREGRDYRIDFRYQTAGGPLKRLSSVAAPLRRSDGSLAGFISVTLDRTVELETAAAMERSLREKETLLKEIHHRVKNNLQVIGSIIGLQANRSEDPELRSLLQELRGRVHAIAHLHERLYRSHDLGAIDLGEYLKGLVGDAARAAGAAKGRVTVRGPDTSLVLGMDDCLSVGLIVNELVSNALKHGSGITQCVQVNLGLEADLVRLEVVDEGPGFPDDFAPERSTTLGMLLLRSLAKHLGGELSFRSRPARVTLAFSRQREGHA